MHVDKFCHIHVFIYFYSHSVCYTIRHVIASCYVIVRGAIRRMNLVLTSDRL